MVDLFLFLSSFWSSRPHFHSFLVTFLHIALGLLFNHLLSLSLLFSLSFLSCLLSLIPCPLLCGPFEQTKQAAKQKLNTPLLLRLMDEKGLKDLEEVIEEELEDLYPDLEDLRRQKEESRRERDEILMAERMRKQNRRTARRASVAATTASQSAQEAGGSEEEAAAAGAAAAALVMMENANGVVVGTDGEEGKNGNEEKEEEEEEDGEMGEMMEEEEEGDKSTVDVTQHLSKMNEVLAYMRDAVKDCRKTKAYAARLDVLCVVFVRCNLFLEKRLKSVVEDSLAGIEYLTTMDVYAFLSAFSRYKKFMERTYCPATSYANGLEPSITQLSGLITPLARTYVKRSSGKLHSHVGSIWRSFLNNPKELLQQHTDGSWYTLAPVDIWETLNQHLSLATQTTAPILHVLVANQVVKVLTKAIHKINAYVLNFDAAMELDPELRDIELELCSALANDTALHIEEVVNVVTGFTIRTVRGEVDELFDSVSDELVICGQSCLQRISRIVATDLKVGGHDIT
jgi:hypothetical protein